MKIEAIILARKNSKGIPNKNIINFCGKPLIEWTIIQLKKTMNEDNIWISSDSIDILKIAKRHKVNSITRPTSLAMDESTSEDAWCHAIDIIEEQRDFDAILAPQITSPIREPSDFKNGIELFVKSKADSLLSVCEVEDYFFWELNNNQKPVSINYDFSNRKMRQSIKKKYLENGSFYIFKKRLIKKSNCRLGGKIVILPMEKYKMYQIDNKSDLELCSIIMKGYKLNE